MQTWNREEEEDRSSEEVMQREESRIFMVPDSSLVYK